MDYEKLRIFADSWGLLYLIAIFAAVVIYTFRPGSSKRAREQAQIPFKEEEPNG